MGTVTTPPFFDNRANIVKDDLVATIEAGDRVSVAAGVFSMYVYQALKDQLDGLEEFRFIFTSQTFTQERPKRQAREFYIPRLSRESGLYGTQLEIRLRNELTQKSVSSECARWIRKKARFKSYGVENGMGNSFLVDEKPQGAVAYTPFTGFTTAELGVERDADRPALIMRAEAPASTALLDMFDRAWDSGELNDVTDAVVDSITAMYQENAPETVYYMALYRIFHEFLDDVSEDVLPNEGTGFRDSAIWGKLYDFQRDAAVAIINKLETYGGCILADSVGLGKTFAALAVIKYYESRNRNVLVLCPKKLKDNWITYNSNVVNNSIAADRLRYDVLFHTDLSRTRGVSETGLPLDRINWGNYDLVVIDESHNFRNGGDSATDGKLNRYQTLMERVIRQGVKTKVLMLSATPVNNRFRDLRNQLALAYQGDPKGWSEKLKISTDIETVFRRAQAAYKAWAKLPVEGRTTERLMDMLDPDFFEVLDQVTVARSRRHIQRYYDMSAIGLFPKRRKPVSRQPNLSTLPGSITYNEIYDELDSLKLAVYMPSSYLQPSHRHKYEPEKGGSNRNLSIAGRETGVRRLMTANLLKRLESSVSSFALTLNRVLAIMEENIRIVDEYKDTRDPTLSVGSAPGVDLDEDDEGAMEAGGDTGILLEDMDWLRWQRDMLEDAEVMRVLIGMVADIDPAHDAKLLQLEADIRDKVAHPINPGNRKAIVFTAFSDTAAYLYQHLSRFAEGELGGMRCGLVTGSACKTNCLGVRADMTEILECFSPVSKERDALAPRLAGHDIDLLIATDCISEGQNLQDCDWLVNYDIHWNPVRIVQRFGRIDRIGSKSAEIQLVNYWPNVELDKYINLKERVKARTRITVMTSTGDDDYVNPEEQGDLEYRKRQLLQMREEVVDLEDVSGGVSITDLGLNEFRMDLVAYSHDHPDLDRLPLGVEAVVEGDEPGIVFVLRNMNGAVDPGDRNRIRPFYLVYVGDDGTIVHGHLDPKATLDEMRALCKGKGRADRRVYGPFNKATKNGRDMRWATRLLGETVASIVGAKEESDVDSFFGGGTTGFLEGDVQGLDDFELVCFLVVRPKC